MSDKTTVFEIPEDLWDAMLRLPDDASFEAHFNLPDEGDFSLTLKERDGNRSKREAKTKTHL